METPTVDGLNETIQANLIKKHMLTIGNVNLATKAYDPDVGENEGNNMRSMLTPVVSNIVKITNELLEVQLDLKVSMDGLTVNSLKFLFKLSHELYYRTTKYVTKSLASI